MRIKKGKPEKQLGQIILAVRMSVWLVLKWSPISFGPLTFLGPEKFGPYNDFHAGTKFHRDQISRVPNFSWPKKVRGPNEIADHLSTSRMFAYHEV